MGHSTFDNGSTDVVLRRRIYFDGNSEVFEAIQRSVAALGAVQSQGVEWATSTGDYHVLLVKPQNGRVDEALEDLHLFFSRLESVRVTQKFYICQDCGCAGLEMRNREPQCTACHRTNLVNVL